MKASFSPSPGMRCVTGETSDGKLYGICQSAPKGSATPTHELFEYSVGDDRLKLLGPCWLTGSYTAVAVLSPDERFVYYLPGSHGQAFKTGTPVVRDERATGRRTVVAFLAPYCERELDYVPAGTYGMKLSADGRTMYVNFNGHPADRVRPAKMRRMASA